MDPTQIRLDMSLFRSLMPDKVPVNLTPIDGEDDDDDDEAPETPTDEPSPIPIQDPPAEPSSEPLTVTCLSSCPR
jgi:hypothetical protein